MGLSCRQDETICFARFQDEEVVRFANHGSQRAAEYLMTRYRFLVVNKARTYYLIGADHDDVIQEGMIGLYKAIRDFRCERLSKFRPFAELCVTRQIITAVNAATRQKHIPLNTYVSLNASLLGEGNDSSLLDVLPDLAGSNPENSLIGRKLPPNLHDAVKHALSDLESHVLLSYLEGMSYLEISQELHCHAKSVDNALQRVKRKIGMLLKD